MPTSKKNEKWTADEVAEQFRLEVQQGFAAENAAYVKEELEDIAKVKQRFDLTGEPYPEWLSEAEQNVHSFFWDIYEDLTINIVNNSVEIIVPRGYAIYADFIEMFGYTSVGWSFPMVKAKIINGDPHVVIEVVLIDYWDDERHAEWLTKKN